MTSYSEMLLIIKKGEIMPFAATWMDLDIMMLSEVSQKKTNTFYHFTKGKMNKNFVSTGDKWDSLGGVLLGSKAPDNPPVLPRAR